MKGKTHAGVGAITFFVLCSNMTLQFSYVGVGVVIFASLLPDIDHPKSIINKYILPFKSKGAKVTLYVCSGLIVLWYDYLYGHDMAFKALGISLISVGVSSHRNGLTHSLVGMILFTSIAAYLGQRFKINDIIYYFILGYGMHLLCDMMTNMGVPLFYPFKNKKMKFPITYKTGSKMGTIIEELIVILGLIYVVYRSPSIFTNMRFYMK